MGDAPFVGALISSCDCKFNCQDCFNQSIKYLPTINSPAEEIIKEVKENIFNKGIILAGLEWSLQINEAQQLASLAKEHSLYVMLYTGNTLSEISRICDSTKYGLKYFDYIKCGRYDAFVKTINHEEYGVVLASKNQHIYKKGIDYCLE